MNLINQPFLIFKQYASCFEYILVGYYVKEDNKSDEFDAGKIMKNLQVVFLIIQIKMYLYLSPFQWKWKGRKDENICVCVCVCVCNNK